MCKLLLAKKIEHIALVLREIFRLLEKPPSGLLVLLNPRIMPGHDGIALHLLRPVVELLMLHIAVTIDARVRRAARLIGLHKPVNNLLVEILGEIQHIIRHAKLRAHLPRVLGIGQRAAGIRPAHSDVFIIVKLHRHADAAVVFLTHESGGDRTIDAAAHRDQGLLTHKSFSNAYFWWLCGRVRTSAGHPVSWPYYINLVLRIFYWLLPGRRLVRLLKRGCRLSMIRRLRGRLRCRWLR